MSALLRLGLLCALVLCAGQVEAQIPSPRLAFLDLVSGPATGNGDTSRGQRADVHGAIVTLWGTNLGTSQGTSTVTVGGVPASAVYYWGNAVPPACGPANLYNGYQNLQCVIFQVAAATPSGPSDVVVTVGGVRAPPATFTVRAGRIFFAAVGGGGAGTYASPFATIESADGVVGSGDIMYVRDGLNQPSGVSVPVSSQCSTDCANGSIALVTYPGATSQVGDATHAGFLLVHAGSGLSMTYSKFLIYGGTRNAEGVSLRSNSRMVGNRITAPIGYGASGSAGGRGNNLVIVGNEFTGCGGFSGDGLYHTLYIYGLRGCGSACMGETNRDIGWNYFHDNLADRAINIYNDNQGSGSAWISGHTIHHNVIVNQNAEGIGLLGGTVGENWVTNNLLIDVGQSPTPGGEGAGIWVHGFAPAGGVVPPPAGLYHITNNTIINAGDAKAATGTNGTFLFDYTGTLDLQNNLIYQANGFPYVAWQGTSTPVTGDGQSSRNLWYGAGAPPAWDTNSVNADPLFVSPSTGDYRLQAGSPARRAGSVLGVDLGTEATPDKFTVGQTVSPTTLLNVRATPNGMILGTQVKGARGVVLAGPVIVGTSTWWQLDYATGADGWSSEAFLVTAPPPPVADYPFTVPSGKSYQINGGPILVAP